ncbi:TonB-dependent receptor [Pedobacter gandavensis]|uniref:SusC/RagA family TonB-linked outer membrane protein n=1 Tax=Pedobacter gandavensis TaxID=2679963 RepID=UPI002930D013|nr:TonB-dependent receptor [Pedobacter gandavensis]
MKLIILLVTTAILQVSAAGYAQKNITITARNSSLESVLKTLRKQSGFDLVVVSNTLSKAAPVNISVTKVSLEEALKICFQNQPFEYSIDTETIIVQEKQRPVQKMKAAFSYKITGEVRDELSNPIPGVNVVVLHGARKTSTNNQGKYAIDVEPTDTLEFSYIGYKKQMLPVRNRLDLNIVLEPTQGSLDEVLVVGYGKQKSSQLVSSISTIKGEQLQLPGRSLQNGLAGQVAGLFAVQRSGEPGYDNAEIWIRGVSSFAGGTGALVLVDGVPRKISDISPEEVETFTILKDASATAIYGAEGANGVILVTSKRGKNQKTTIDFRADYNVNQPTRTIDFLGSADFLRLYNEAKWNTEGNPNMSSFIPYKTEAEIAKYASGEDPDLYPSTNWMDLLKKDAISQRYALNFRGGGDKLRFFVATSYYTEEGLFKSNPIDANEFAKTAKYNTNIGLDRYNLRSNVDLDISKTTLLRVDMSGQYLTTNYPGTGTATIFSNMMRSAPHLIPMIYSNNYPSRYSAAAGYENPYNQLNFSGYTKEYRVALQTNVGLEQKLPFLPGLLFKTSVSFDTDFNSLVSRTRTPSQFLATGRDADGNLIFRKIVNGLNTATEASGGGFSEGNKRIYMETSLNYNRAFSEDHSVSGLLLYMQKESQLQNNPYLYKKQGIVGRGSYAFKDKYFFDASFGFTGSENFAAGNRFGFFPALGLGYTISNEKGLKSMFQAIGVDRLKIRMSIGRAGNDQISNTRFPYKESLTWSSENTNLGMTSGGGTNNTGNMIYENKAFNPDISWEIEEKRNIGIDLMAFKGALDFTIDYFNNRRHDILLQRNTVNQVAGFMNNPYQNFGVVTNKGIDASINANRKFGEFGVSVRGTFTYAHNKIIEMDEIPRPNAYQNSTGTSIGQVDAWVAERLYTDNDFNITSNATNGAKSYVLKPGIPVSKFGPVYPGNIKYADLNNDGVIDDSDWTRLLPNARPFNPEIIYGFGLNLTYKGFYASAFFQGVGNTSVYLEPSQTMPFIGVDPMTTSAKSFSTDRWSVENPDPSAMLPRLQLNNTNLNDNRRSTWFLRSGSFLRFKNMEVGYAFTKKQLEKIGIQGLRVYALGQNLGIIWDDIKFYDPEQGNASSGLRYPIQRTINFGVELKF